MQGAANEFIWLKKEFTCKRIRTAKILQVDKHGNAALTALSDVCPQTSVFSPCSAADSVYKILECYIRQLKQTELLCAGWAVAQKDRQLSILFRKLTTPIGTDHRHPTRGCIWTLPGGFMKPKRAAVLYGVCRTATRIVRLRFVNVVRWRCEKRQHASCINGRSGQVFGCSDSRRAHLWGPRNEMNTDWDPL